ncbi:ribonuclease M5 [uncultured Thomasclavelia sp.]|uniref:ribonuclease M5 n=1 Tax=uncultured Thomasclavelia sp. TaxID=3025759 RepID=UPI0025EAACE4|nr:ribonuclease M5 [uncultured Thomasclavelia sp.]
MNKIKEVVVVEGKTDSALLKELFEVDTIETHGLAIDDQTMVLIKEAAKSRGIIVLTDPDFPGKKIRDLIQKQVPNCKHAFVAKKDAVGKKKVGIAEARKEAVVAAIENVVTFDSENQSISWPEFLELDIIGNKQKRLKIYQEFNLGYGNVKTLFRRLNMVGITKEEILRRVGNVVSD